MAYKGVLLVVIRYLLLPFLCIIHSFSWRTGWWVLPLAFCDFGIFWSIWYVFPRRSMWWYSRLPIFRLMSTSSVLWCFCPITGAFADSCSPVLPPAFYHRVWLRICVCLCRVSSLDWVASVPCDTDDLWYYYTFMWVSVHDAPTGVVEGASKMAVLALSPGVLYHCVNYFG